MKEKKKRREEDAKKSLDFFSRLGRKREKINKKQKKQK